MQETETTLSWKTRSYVELEFSETYVKGDEYEYYSECMEANTLTAEELLTRSKEVLRHARDQKSGWQREVEDLLYVMPDEIICHDIPYEDSDDAIVSVKERKVYIDDEIIRENTKAINRGCDIY